MAKKRNVGGGAWYSGGDSKVAKEAKDVENNAIGGAVKKKNKGGAVKRAFGGRTVGKPSGAVAASRLDKRARGGGIANLGAYAHGGKIQRFASGGIAGPGRTGEGSDKNPYSTASMPADKAGKSEAVGSTAKIVQRASGGSVKKK